MTVKDYVARVVEINGYLHRFHDGVQGVQATALPEDMLVDLLEFGVPVAWQKIRLHDIQLMNGTVRKFVDFYEHM